jgi:hypothetical protein
MGVNDPVTVAIITSIPATLAAGAAWYAAHRSNQGNRRIEKTLKPSNGQKISEIMEEARDTADSNSRRLVRLQDTMEEHLAEAAIRLDDLTDCLTSHLEDSRVHYQETHRHIINEVTGVCDVCLSPVP